MFVFASTDCVGFVFGHCFVVQYLVSFLVSNHLTRAERAGCLYHVAVSVLCLFLMVPWIDLQCVIVVFPGHIHLPFGGKIS